MKKVFALILAASMLLLYVGCAPQTEQPNPEPDTDVTEQENETKNDNYAEPDGTTDPNTITADENTEEPTPDTDEVADDGENTLELTGKVTVTSMEELKKLYEAGCFGYSDHFYDYFYSFFVEGWEIPEVNDIVFSNISFTFTIPFDNFAGVDYSFTVEESNVEGFKPGNYRRHIQEGAYDFFITDPDADPDAEKDFYAVEETKKLYAFFISNRIWNTPAYGKGITYPGAYDYVHVKYGESGNYYKLDYESVCKYAEEEFGVTNPELMVVCGYLLENDQYNSRYESYPYEEFDVTDVRETANGKEITVQFYADLERFIYSHKILYYFDGDGRFNGYKVLEKGKYEPRGMHYIEDDGIIRTNAVNNLKFYIENGLFDEEQYDFYIDFLKGHRGEYDIYNYTIAFKPDQDKSAPFESYIYFEVTDSKHATLPVGEYHRKLVSGEVMSFEDVDPSEAAKVIIGETQTH